MRLPDRTARLDDGNHRFLIGLRKTMPHHDSYRQGHGHRRSPAARCAPRLHNATSHRPEPVPVGLPHRPRPPRPGNRRAHRVGDRFGIRVAVLRSHRGLDESEPGELLLRRLRPSGNRHSRQDPGIVLGSRALRRRVRGLDVDGRLAERSPPWRRSSSWHRQVGASFRLRPGSSPARWQRRHRSSSPCRAPISRKPSSC